MPNINDALVPAEGMTGYSPAPSVPVSLPAPFHYDEPIHNNMIRCPMPTLWQSTPDSLRQFYLQGRVPQSRIMTPIVAPAKAINTGFTGVRKVGSITLTVKNGAITGVSDS